jgi:hypothetical protein
LVELGFQTACALTSMMARSNRSKQRPDTLMQDHNADRSTNFLATHGRLIHSGQMRRFEDEGRWLLFRRQRTFQNEGACAETCFAINGERSPALAEAEREGGGAAYGTRRKHLGLPGGLSPPGIFSRCAGKTITGSAASQGITTSPLSFRFVMPRRHRFDSCFVVGKQPRSDYQAESQLPLGGTRLVISCRAIPANWPIILPDPCLNVALCAERGTLQFRVNGYSTLAELVVSLYQSITSLNSEKP